MCTSALKILETKYLLIFHLVLNCGEQKLKPSKPYFSINRNLVQLPIDLDQQDKSPPQPQLLADISMPIPVS